MAFTQQPQRMTHREAGGGVHYSLNRIGGGIKNGDVPSKRIQTGTETVSGEGEKYKRVWLNKIGSKKWLAGRG